MWGARTIAAGIAVALLLAGCTGPPAGDDAPGAGAAAGEGVAWAPEDMAEMINDDLFNLPPDLLYRYEDDNVPSPFSAGQRER